MASTYTVKPDGGVSVVRAQWTAAYINTLPDSSFLYIEPGGTKDADGKTTPRSLRHFPVKDAQGNVDMPHLRNALSRIPQSNLPASVKAQCVAKANRMMPSQNSGRGPRRDEFRARPVGYELRQDGDGMPTLTGHLAVFDEWAEINSMAEGHFLERISPGAFTKTIKENLPRMRCLFNHGKDPVFAEKPLGPITSLTPDDRGLAYEVELLDTSYNRDLVQMLRANPPVLGSSFRFAVTRETFNRKADKSQHNPRGLPERTVQEVRMSEFGPVTFPAYAGTGAGLRSVTDRMMFGEERMDYDDVDTLAQMICLAVDYIGEQDEPGDETNVPKMEAVIQTLYELQGYEVQEPEAPEDEGDGEMASTDDRAEGTTSGSRTSTTTSAAYSTLVVDAARTPSKTYLEKGKRSWELP